MHKRRDSALTMRQPTSKNIRCLAMAVTPLFLLIIVFVAFMAEGAIRTNSNNFDIDDIVTLFGDDNRGIGGCTCYHEGDEIVCHDSYRYELSCAYSRALQGTWVEVGTGDFLTSITFYGIRFEAHVYTKLGRVELDYNPYIISTPCGTEIERSGVTDVRYSFEQVQALSSKPWRNETSLGGELITEGNAMSENSDQFTFRMRYPGTFIVPSEGQIELRFSINFNRCRPYNAEIFTYWLDEDMLVICNGLETTVFTHR